MRIAITVDPFIPVPPIQYGGIERIVDFVARGLVGKGHTVTLFAHPGSSTAGHLVPYGVPPHSGFRARMIELGQLGSELWTRRKEFDAVFSWGRLASLVPILGCRDLPKVQRYCRNIVPWRSVKTAVRIAGDSVSFAGASSSVYQELPRHGSRGGVWHTLYDGVEIEKYTFVRDVPSNAPLVFLGRLERIKGVHTAIRIAQVSGRRLIIAGNRVSQPEGVAYFEQEVKPHLDGRQVTFVGPVDDAQKNQLLGRASALLFPIQWKEAFGIVMAEAFACGTPVIGFDSGSVPEIVKDGVNGFVRHDVDGAIEAVNRLPNIDRSAVRADCEARFTDGVVVAGVERIIRAAVAKVRGDS